MRAILVVSSDHTYVGCQLIRKSILIFFFNLLLFKNTFGTEGQSVAARRLWAGQPAGPAWQARPGLDDPQRTELET